MNDLQSALMALGYRKPTEQGERLHCTDTLSAKAQMHYIPVTTYTSDGRLQVQYRIQTVYDTIRKNVIKTNNSRKLQYCL